MTTPSSPEALLTALTMFVVEIVKHSPNRALIIDGANQMLPDAAEALMFFSAPDDFRAQVSRAIATLAAAIEA